MLSFGVNTCTLYFHTSLELKFQRIISAVSTTFLKIKYERFCEQISKIKWQNQYPIPPLLHEHICTHVKHAVLPANFTSWWKVLILGGFNVPNYSLTSRSVQ